MPDSPVPNTADTPTPPTGILARLAASQRGVSTFFARDLWLVNLTHLRGWTRLWYTLLRISATTVNGFISYKCALQANALTYITLMSMVPVFALMFAVAKGFGAHERIQMLILERAQNLPPQAAEAIVRVFSYVENTNLKALGWIGVAFLFLTAHGTMSMVETTFNTIWRVRTPRTWIRRITDYFMILFMAPFLLLVGTTVNATLSAPTTQDLLRTYTGPLLYGLFRMGMGCSVVVVVIMAFFVLYILMPNTRVKITAALAGGTCAGISWALLQWVYIKFQIGAANANAIYGTFAVVPLFLAWLYASWTVVLGGALVSQAVQNLDVLDSPLEFTDISPAVRQKLGLLVLGEIASDFRSRREPPTARQLATRLTLPLGLVRDALKVLVFSRVVAETVARSPGHVPASDLDVLTLADIETAFRAAEPAGAAPLPPPPTTAFEAAFQQEYGTFLKALEGKSLHSLLAPATKPQA